MPIPVPAHKHFPRVCRCIKTLDERFPWSNSKKMQYELRRYYIQTHENLLFFSVKKTHHVQLVLSMYAYSMVVIYLLQIGHNLYKLFILTKNLFHLKGSRPSKVKPGAPKKRIQ